MHYLETQKKIKEQAKNLFPEAKSILSVAVSYHPHPRQTPDTPTDLKIAKYAAGEDYHFWLLKRLEQLAEKLKVEFPHGHFLPMTDSKALLERDFARQLGLGWIGKNTCLIHPKIGSYFLLGEILCDLEIESENISNPIPDFCGKCTRCIEACPTQALDKNKKLDARKCLSYWNIESKRVPPINIRESMQDQFFGCDICQDVCPWNQKFIKNMSKNSEQKPQPVNIASELEFFLTASNRQMETRFKNSPLLRARPRGLRRNALIVAANLKIKSLLPQVQKLKSDSELMELATWTENKINSQDSY